MKDKEIWMQIRICVFGSLSPLTMSMINSQPKKMSMNVQLNQQFGVP